MAPVRARARACVMGSYSPSEWKRIMGRVRARLVPDTTLTYAAVISHLRRQPRRKDRPRCGAKTRAGGTCMMRVEFGKARCRLHGGRSTGPKTEAGRARIAEAQRRRWRAFRDAHVIKLPPWRDGIGYG
jgi:hypothetical protein